MRVLLDTNIIVANANRDDVHHPRVAAGLRRLVAEGAELCIAAQNIFELWVVATRPVTANGLGLSPPEARQKIDGVLAACTLPPDPAGLLPRWLDVCEQYRVCGRQAHDARLAAWMQLLGMKKVVTLNPGDFARYPDIECIGLE